MYVICHEPCGAMRVVLCTCLSHTPETTHTRRTHTLHGAAPPHRRTALKPQQPRDHHATHQNRKEPSGGPLSQSPPALPLSSPLLPRYPLVSTIPYGPERKPERTDTFPFHAGRSGALCGFLVATTLKPDHQPVRVCVPGDQDALRLTSAGRGDESPRGWRVGERIPFRYRFLTPIPHFYLCRTR